MHDWKKMMNESYPDDLYDDGDYIVEKRNSELKREMIAHIIMGFGLGIMATVGLAGAIAWIMG